MFARIIIESILVFLCAVIGGGCAMFGLSASAPLTKIALGAVGLVNTAAAMMLAIEVRKRWEHYKSCRAVARAYGAFLSSVKAIGDYAASLAKAAEQAKIDEEHAVRNLLCDLEG